VAVDEKRLDLLRVLILPGQDTPYANGAFLFDVLLPATYPNTPPQVRSLAILKRVVKQKQAVAGSVGDRA
jgi:ubiquitin-protein ligase